MTTKGDKETPLMKQYNDIKRKYPSAMLLFRVGDFYETFGEDAVTASKILNITLTKRSNGSASEVALAGFPHHSLEGYMTRLVQAGVRVAVCDQLEDPKDAVGIVKRGVTELVTPGVAMLDNVLDQNRNNFLAAVHQDGNRFGLAFLDISTGEFYCTEADQIHADRYLTHYRAAEVLFNKAKKTGYHEAFQDQFCSFGLEDWIWQLEFATEQLTRHFDTKNLKGFGIDGLRLGTIAAGVILYYLHQTEHKNLGHITTISRVEDERFVWLDKFTLRNLELVEAQQTGGIPLLSILNRTHTPMGGRLLVEWVQRPLKDLVEIEQRLGVVEAFIKNKAIAGELGPVLKQVGDLERLAGKIASRRASPREIVQLKRSLSQMQPIRELLLMSANIALHAIAGKVESMLDVVEHIGTLLRDDAPMLSNQGNMIMPGVDVELDNLHHIATSGKQILLEIQQREVSRTGITSLKVSYNKVFGYYLEVTNAHKDKVPTDWIRKQTLVNAERYITEELKEYEEKIITAESRINQIEQQLFLDLIQYLQVHITTLLTNARQIAQADCLLSFAIVAEANNYCKPSVRDHSTLTIEAGRHPVIERQLPPGETYIPNDILLDTSSQQIMIITGPNMAGKSALLRQTALIVLMAQMGCYVPATQAEIGLVDKVFTRVGASDNLSRGESTFMVEMTETASILNNLSGNSLVLMDEIGRGTSTYDGVSIAWAIVEHLHNNPKARARTLFATHYHELNQLADDLPRVKNFNVAVKEVGNKVVFIRKLKPGGSEHSFGIHVAQMAGIPNTVVLRADEIMVHLEKGRSKTRNQENLREMPKNNYQMSFFEPQNPQLDAIGKLLEVIDINAISPVEALLKLNEMKGLWVKGR